jgi:pyrroloquinoline quinone biosynthesis protein E
VSAATTHFAARALIAEVTHRCPLRCVYCSNPLEMQRRSSELTTEQWTSIFDQAAKLGMMQLSLTGGEPLARADIRELVHAGHEAGLYVNLITSGIGLNDARLDALVAAGLDHVQLSFQDSREQPANEYAGLTAHQIKLQTAATIRTRPVAFTINMVVHRSNVDHLEEMIAFAVECGPQKLEIANVQYYGWAFENRLALVPTREQLQRSVEIVEAARERLRGRVRIDFVTPDYYAKFPKPCMGGWGHQFMLIDPAGRALPCHAAGDIPGFEFPNAGDQPLRWIWEESAAFAAFRGEDWLPEPCLSCDRRNIDFGGCRCQAFRINGDAASTDPVCSLSPERGRIDEILERVNGAESGADREWIYRVDPR